ncbi:MAG: phosphoribosylamine--glycine ligase [Treponema sp.]|jgi:phosphoribosylamine--glycine ligase|nr:phosphoribosylamine--glycine ligase [Treponema sp.]
MKILVIGSGGREHALVWKLAQSEKVEALYAAPGNGGTAGEKKCANIPVAGGDPAGPEALAGLIQFAGREHIDLTVVGPEAPLAEGVVDRFRAAGLAIIGPDQKAARLESSKVYAKSFMQKYGVRAAGSRDFTGAEAALAYIRRHFGGNGPAPLVIKADGLAAGKGVVVAENRKDAEDAVHSFMEQKTLGAAGAALVLEDFLEGREVSVLAAVSVPGGRGPGTIVPFISARDHKRRFDGGRGPNTGGMGAIAPAPDFTGPCQKDFIRHILTPTLAGIKAEGLDYRGFIFFGLMIKDGVCSLLEYNVRLGDPETQAVLPLMDADFAGLCMAIHDGGLDEFPLAWKPGAVCAPVAVAAGYPGDYRKGDPIAVNEAALAKTGALLFAAGARRGEGGALGSGLRTSGGRVLALSAAGAGADEAWEKAYRALGAVHFEGMDYRRDIGREHR